MVPASITRRTSTVHGFYKYLQQEGATERDLLYGVALPKRPKRLPKVLEPAVLNALLAAPDPETPAGPHGSTAGLSRTARLHRTGPPSPGVALARRSICR